MKRAPLPAAAALALLACAPALPDHPVQRALVLDVERVVSVREKAPGWEFDDLEAQAILGDVLGSVCRVDPGHRAAALRFLAEEMQRLGGDPAARWRERNKKLRAIDDLLLVHRTRFSLQRAEEAARAGKCPFWLEPDDEFEGRQVLNGRFFGGFETGGGFNAGIVADQLGWGPGGSARALVGYGIAERWSLMAGVEVGGGARLTEFKLAAEQQIPSLEAYLAAPVILRHRFGLSAHADFEAAYLSSIKRLDIGGDRVSFAQAPGIRVGIGLGASYLRLKIGALPTFTLMLEGDYVPAADQRMAVGRLGISARAGALFSR